MRALAPTLLAISLALAFSAAPAPAAAQSITTSHGVRTMPPIKGNLGEADLRQSVRAGEDVIRELLADLDAASKAYSGANTQAAGFAQSVKQADADFNKSKEALDAMDKAYLDSLAAYEQRQQNLVNEINRQRAAAAPVEALPSAQRDIQEVFRLNDWAKRNDAERVALQGEQQRLTAEHDRVEAERAKLAKQAQDSNASLRNQRDTLVGTASSSTEQMNKTLAQLREAVIYLDSAYTEFNKVAHVKMTPAPILDQARARLRAGNR